MRKQLTENFYLDEFTRSADHPELAFKPDELTDFQVERILMLCCYIAQPVRNQFGQTAIGSGIRTDALNAILPRSSPDSAHKFLQDRSAFDFSPILHSVWKVANWMQLNTPNFRKLIVYPDRRFIHCSGPDSSGVYGQVWECKNGRYTRKH